MTTTQPQSSTLANYLKQAAAMVRQHHGEQSGVTAEQLTHIFEDLGMRAGVRFGAFAALRGAVFGSPEPRELSFWMQENPPEALARALEKASEQCEEKTGTTPAADDLPQRLMRAAALLRERVARSTCPTEHDVWGALTDAGIVGPMRKRAVATFRRVALGNRSASGLSEWIEDSYCGTVVARLETTADVCGRTPAEVLSNAAHLLREKFMPSEVLDEKDLTPALDDSGGSDEARTAAREALARLAVEAGHATLALWLRKTCRREVAKALDRAAEGLAPSLGSAGHV